MLARSFVAGLAGYFILVLAGMHSALVLVTGSGFDFDEKETSLQKLYTFCPYIGTLIGAALGGLFVKLYGNKISTGISVVIIFISGVLYVVPPSSISIYIVAQILAGCSGGIVLVSQIIYLGEISPARRRGKNIVYISTAWYVGTLIQYIINGTVYSDVNLVVGIMTIIICAFAGLSLKGMRESPYYSLLKGNEEKAKEDLAVLNNFKRNSVQLLKEFDEINKCVAEESDSSAREDLIESNKRSYYLSSFYQILYSSSYYIAIVGQNTRYFSIIIIATSSWSDLYIVYLITGTASLLGSLFSAMYIDQAGARKLLAISCFVGSLGVFAISIDIFAEGVVFFTYGSVSAKHIILAGVAVITDIILALGVGSAHNIILGESLTLPSKSMAVCSAIVIQAMTGTLFYFLSSLNLETSSSVFRLVCGIIVSLLLLIGFFVAIKKLPQTQQKTHREIIALYKSNES